MPDFLILALLGGIITSIMTANIGTMMLWRRMAYLGDAISHTTLLALGIGLWLNISFTWTLMGITLLVATFISLHHRNQALSVDTFIAITAHSSLGLGLLALSFLPTARVDLMGYLFGDLLSLTEQDILLLSGICMSTLVVTYAAWRGLLITSLNADLAKLQGYAPRHYELLLAIMIAAIIAVSIKLIGALLMTALLITPAAIARPFVSTPQRMIILAMFISITAVLAGIACSWQWDLPVSASVISLLFSGFLLSRLVKPVSA